MNLEAFEKLFFRPMDSFRKKCFESMSAKELPHSVVLFIPGITGFEPPCVAEAAVMVMMMGNGTSAV